MPGVFGDLTKLLCGEEGGPCYLIFRLGNVEACYDQKGLLSRLSQAHPEYFQLHVSFVDINNTSQPMKLLTKPEVKKIYESLEEAKGLRKKLLGLEDKIGLPE